MTLAQAGKLLGVAPPTLQVQVRKGKLHATLVGTAYTVTPREVERCRAVSLGRTSGAWRAQTMALCGSLGSEFNPRVGARPDRSSTMTSSRRRPAR